MSFFDSASLVQIPSGVKDGVLYSVKPIDGSGDLTFSRGSDIEATRVNANGYIEKAQVNLISASNNFSNGTYWVSGINFTSGQSGYDGTNDAWKAEAGSLNAHIYQLNTTSGVSTLSVYAKAGNISWVRLRFDNTSSTDGNVWFNLSDGSIGSDNGIASYTENVGNGWWRVVAQINTTDLNNVRIYPAASDGNNADTGEYIYIQDAQLNYGLVAQTYQETTTAAVVSGITNDMPRLNYDPANPTCPSLLLEPSRGNALPHSEYLDGYSFTRTDGTQNAATSPEGVNNAFKLFADTQTGSHYIRFNYTKASDAVLSVFAKKGEETSFAIGNASYSQAVVFNLENGTITSETGGNGTIEDYGNGWYRCSYHRTAWADWQYFSLRGNNTTYTGDGSSGLYLFGIQFEDGTYPTSYIPTYGSSATRTADGSNINPSSLLGATQGSWFLNLKDFDFSILGTSLPSVLLGDSDAYCVGLIARAAGVTDIQVCKREGASAIELARTSNKSPKICITWNGSNLKAFIDGVKEYDDNSFSNFTNWDNLIFNYSSRAVKYGLNQTLLFPTQISDADAIALTA